MRFRRRAFPLRLEDCIASGNVNVHIFTAGFRESAEEEGEKLQREIEAIAREGGLHVVGPNCMGWYVPSRKMLTWNAAPAPAGPVSMISQSGGNAQEFTHHAAKTHRLYFNKVISYGNALTLDSPDYLDYLAGDETTSLVVMYLEGVKDGRRLLAVTQEAVRRKPVIIMKGGLSAAGARAASSHTGALGQPPGYGNRSSGRPARCALIRSRRWPRRRRVSLPQKDAAGASAS